MRFSREARSENKQLTRSEPIQEALEMGERPTEDIGPNEPRQSVIIQTSQEGPVMAQYSLVRFEQP